MSDWRELGEEIARAEDAVRAEDGSVERARARYLDGARRVRAARRPGAARRTALGLGLGFAAAAGIALAVSLSLRIDERAPLRATAGEERRAVAVGEWIAAPADSPRRLDFSDGTSLGLDPRSDARIVAISPDGARVSLERGTARVAVKKRPGAKWRVDVGPYAVAVTGTRFVVAWDPEEQLFSLSLEEGGVRVSGPLLGDGRAVTVGERLRAYVADGRLEISRKGAGGDAPTTAPQSASAARVSPVAEETIVSVQDAARRASAPLARPTKSWRDLARAGRHGESVAAADAAGIDTVLGGASAADLLLLGDAARLAQRLNLADRCYLEVRSRHAASRESVTAAFALGRLAFDHQHLYAKAAHWMEVYLGEAGGGAVLAREALGRLIEAHERAGSVADAKRAARRYVEEYPGGPHANLARHVLGLDAEGAFLLP